jgi:hypothetical protein
MTEKQTNFNLLASAFGEIIGEMGVTSKRKNEILGRLLSDCRYVRGINPHLMKIAFIAGHEKGSGREWNSHLKFVKEEAKRAVV